MAVLNSKQPSVKADYDVVIVGGGLVGSALACALASEKTELRIAVIEGQADEDSSNKPRFQGTNFDPRVSAISAASQHLLQRVGAWPADYQLRAAAYRQMHVWDAEGTGEVTFDAREAGASCLGYIIENSVLMMCLRRAISQHTGITILQPIKVQSIDTSKSVKVITLDNGRRLSTSLLVAADGANSFIRKQLNFDTREWDYGHQAIVTSVRVERSHQQTAWQRFLPEGPLAFLPLATDSLSARADGSHYCSIVWSAQDDYADSLMALDDALFNQRLGAAFEFRLGNVSMVGPRFSFPLRQRHAKSYSLPGVVLVGDAAHTIHPLAGQGVNLGFGDVEVLAEEILRAHAKGIGLGHPSLGRRYQRRRKMTNLSAMGSMELFKRLFEQKSLPVRLLRNIGMQQVDSHNGVKRRLIALAMGR